MQGDELWADAVRRGASADRDRAVVETGRSAQDIEEDRQYGKARRGDELPDELARLELRLHAIQAAKARLEARQREQDRVDGRHVDDAGHTRGPQGGLCKPRLSFQRNSTGEDISHFFKRFYESELSRDFGVYRLSLDALRAHIQQYIIERGLSSLFYNHLICDAIMHPGIRTDEIEAIVLGIMSKLDGVKHLLIIGAFFYGDKPDCLLLLEKIFRSMSSKLEKVTFITRGKRVSMRPGVHNVFSTVAPGIQINDVVTEDFHDRYWIDVENTKGVMVGTSLNGIGKKVAMIDHANFADSREIVRLASGLL